MSLLLPFIFGLILAYLVNPVVDWFVSMGLRRDRVVIVLYLFFLLGGIGVFSWFFPVLYHEANVALSQIPTYASALNEMINGINSEIQKVLSHVVGQEKAQNISIAFRTDEFIDRMISNWPSSVLNVAHLGIWVLLIPFVSFFALAQGKEWIGVIYQWTPSQYVESLLGLMAELNARLGGFFRGVMVESMCVGFLTMVGLMILGVEGAVLLGVITGIVNVVPFMAPLIGGCLALLAAYFQQKILSVLIGIFLLFIIVRLFDDFVLIPFIVGHHVHLHPVIMVFAILFGIELGGVLGLVFAIPIAAVLKVVLTILLENRHHAVVLKHGTFT